MPQLEVTVEIHADPTQIYDLLKKMEEYPSFMEHLQTVKILEQGDGWTITKWQTCVVGQKWQWTELDQFDDQKLRIEYKQKSGDLKEFEGFWQVNRLPQGSEVKLVTNFDLGVPVMAELLNPVLHQVLKSNCLSMLHALKDHLESP